ncbi:MAG: gluconokinase [Hellea sp.]
MTVYILMGVSGCGKSTVGRQTAERLKILFLEGDDFHPDTNIAKMSNGIALSDRDRGPWVDAMIKACNIAGPQSQHPQSSIILACSALSETVRERLRKGLAHKCHFIHLQGDHAVLEKRLLDRKGHFFKPELLSSQFAALDIPRSAATLDISQPIDALVSQLIEIIHLEDEA